MVPLPQQKSTTRLQTYQRRVKTHRVARSCKKELYHGQCRKILIVDDDTDLRDTLVEQLSLHDEFEASAVDTGAKGSHRRQANSPTWC